MRVISKGCNILAQEFIAFQKLASMAAPPTKEVSAIDGQALAHAVGPGWNLLSFKPHSSPDAQHQGRPQGGIAVFAYGALRLRIDVKTVDYVAPETAETRACSRDESVQPSRSRSRSPHSRDESVQPAMHDSTVADDMPPELPASTLAKAP